MESLAPVLNYGQEEDSVFLSKEAPESEGRQNGPLKDKELHRIRAYSDVGACLIPVLPAPS